MYTPCTPYGCSLPMLSTEPAMHRYVPLCAGLPVCHSMVTVFVLFLTAPPSTYAMVCNDECCDSDERDGSSDSSDRHTSTASVPSQGSSSSSVSALSSVSAVMHASSSSACLKRACCLSCSAKRSRSASASVVSVKGSSKLLRV